MSGFASGIILIMIHALVSSERNVLSTSRSIQREVGDCLLLGVTARSRCGDERVMEVVRSCPRRVWRSVSNMQRGMLFRYGMRFQAWPPCARALRIAKSGAFHCGTILSSVGRSAYCGRLFACRVWLDCPLYTGSDLIDAVPRNDVMGQSLPGRPSSSSGHVRCAPTGGSKLPACDMPLRVDGDAHNVISSQQPVEKWRGAASGNLGRGIVSSLHRAAVAPWHPPRAARPSCPKLKE